MAGVTQRKKLRLASVKNGIHTEFFTETKYHLDI